MSKSAIEDYIKKNDIKDERIIRDIYSYMIKRIELDKEYAICGFDINRLQELYMEEYRSDRNKKYDGPYITTTKLKKVSNEIQK